MPRVKMLRGEIGTSGDYALVDVTQGVETALYEAIQSEHYCTDNHCDITHALEEGFIFSSAHLLQGATETPLLDSVLSFFNVSFADRPSDWDDWVSYHKENAKECEGCGSFCFVSFDGDTCDNCGGSL